MARYIRGVILWLVVPRGIVWLIYLVLRLRVDGPYVVWKIRYGFMPTLEEIILWLIAPRGFWRWLISEPIWPFTAHLMLWLQIRAWHWEEDEWEHALQGNLLLEETMVS